MSSRIEIEPEDRREVQENGPAPRRQIVRASLLCLVVAALVGGSWWAGHSNKPAAVDPNAVPEIHADAAPVKQVPANPGGLQVPDQDSVLLNQEGKQQPEELLPPPEAAKPRPVAPKPSAPPPPSVAQAASAPPPPAAVVPPVLAPSTPAPQIADAPAAPPIPAAIPQTKTRPTSAASASGGYRLQLGALGSEDAAKAEWSKLQKQQPDILGKLSLSVSRIDLAKGTYYRIQAGPIADAAQAAQSCATLKSRNVGCILIKP